MAFLICEVKDPALLLPKTSRVFVLSSMAVVIESMADGLMVLIEVLDPARLTCVILPGVAPCKSPVAGDESFGPRAWLGTSEGAGRLANGEG